MYTLLKKHVKGIGLVEKKRLGLGKANILYVKNFIIQETKEPGGIQDEIIHQELCISQLQNDENHNSGNVIFTKQELLKSQCNNQLTTVRQWFSPQFSMIAL